MQVRTKPPPPRQMPTSALPEAWLLGLECGTWRIQHPDFSFDRLSKALLLRGQSDSRGLERVILKNWRDKFTEVINRMLEFPALAWCRLDRVCLGAPTSVAHLQNRRPAEVSGARSRQYHDRTSVSQEWCHWSKSELGSWMNQRDEEEWVSAQ